MSNPNDPNLQQPAAPQYSPPPPPAAPPAAPYTAAPQYAAAPPQYAPEKKTNVMSIISMISSIVGLFTFGILCLLGVILGHVSLNQIKRTNEGGKGMAITGLVVGYIGIVGWIIGMIIFFVVLSMVGAAMSDPNFVAELENLS